MKNYHFLFLVFSLVVCGCKNAPKSVDNIVTTEQLLQHSLDSIYNSNPGSVGLMVHVESPDRNISWSGAVGVSSLESATALEIDQPVLIASNTKTYTAASILKLIEQEKLALNAPIDSLISQKSAAALTSVGYNLDGITIAHLLSHTSGIRDYVNEAYMEAIDKDKTHRWTRDEQVHLATQAGGPLGLPGDGFSYADVNFLLLTEIIETSTSLPFYTATRNLIDYKKLGLNHTWYESLENQPPNAKPRVHQYWSEMGWNSYDLDPSFDLYGAGGVATTSKDLALFSQALFEGKIIKSPQVLDLIYTKIDIKEGDDPHYFMGLQDSEIAGRRAYGHGGFWGTVVQYIPELNTSISVFVLERDHRILRAGILETMVQLLASERKKQLISKI